MWRQGQTHHPYTLSFRGTWGHGEYSVGYIDVETGTQHPYTVAPVLVATSIKQAPVLSKHFYVSPN